MENNYNFFFFDFLKATVIFDRPLNFQLLTFLLLKFYIDLLADFQAQIVNKY